MFASILVASSLVLAGCGGDDKGDEPDEPGAESSTAPDVPDTWPLTGLEVPGGKSAALTHPVMVLKMESPQSIGSRKNHSRIGWKSIRRRCGEKECAWSFPYAHSGNYMQNRQ